MLENGQEGRPVWLGAATRDSGVELSRDTGQVTHRIDADIDAERTLLTADLVAAKVVEAAYEVTGIGPTLDGRNGGGDRYYTDGEIVMARLVQGCNSRVAATERLENPTPVKIKNRLWRAMVRNLRLLF